MSPHTPPRPRADKLVSNTMRTITAALLVFFLPAAAQEAPRRITIGEAVTLSGAGSIIVAPDGSVAHSQRQIDLAANKSTIRWHGEVCGASPVAADTSADIAVCSPAGDALAMVANVEGETGIYVRRRGETFLVTRFNLANAFLPAAGATLAWSPTGDHLAFVGTLEPDPDPPDPVVISRLPYKSRTALSDNRRTRVYVVPALPGAKPRPVTPPEFDSHSITWLAGSGEIVYASNREPDPAANHNYDLFAVDPLRGTTRSLTATPGVEMTPLASPAGNWIAYTATTRKVTTIDSVAEDRHVWVIPAAGGDARELNPKLDRRCTLHAWTPDSRSVLYTAQDHGKTVLWKTEIATGASEKLIDEPASIGAVGISRDAVLYYTRSDPGTLPELYRRLPGAAAPERLTYYTRALLSGLPLSRPETISFASFDGAPAEGWLYPPLDPAPGEKWPLILTVHGGPHGMYGYGFSSTNQLLAARGYAVLALNPRGSSGYGQAFSDGCVNDWGGGDYRDLMSGVDYALEHYPVHPDRLGVMGGSYGGYMTNWIITQTPRFRAAVAVASLSNLISFYATSLYQDLVHAEFAGFPWQDGNFQTLWDRSPLKHIARARTPTLLLHGEQDNDVHITQAEEMFTALRLQGVPSTFVRYPREGHSFNEPKHRADYLVRILEWFGKHL